MRRASALLGLVCLLSVPLGTAWAANSSPIQVSPDGASVWVVNPDSDTVAKLDTATNTRLAEIPVGHYPRTLAVTASRVYVTNQGDDTISSMALDGSDYRAVPLDFGCAPYAIVATATQVLVTCQNPSTLLVLGTDLNVVRTVSFTWPEARALALDDNG